MHESQKITHKHSSHHFTANLGEKIMLPSSSDFCHTPNSPTTEQIETKLQCKIKSV